MPDIKTDLLLASIAAARVSPESFDLDALLGNAEQEIRALRRRVEREEILDGDEIAQRLSLAIPWGESTLSVPIQQVAADDGQIFGQVDAAWLGDRIEEVLNAARAAEGGPA